MQPNEANLSENTQPPYLMKRNTSLEFCNPISDAIRYVAYIQGVSMSSIYAVLQLGLT